MCGGGGGQCDNAKQCGAQRDGDVLPGATVVGWLILLAAEDEGLGGAEHGIPLLSRRRRRQVSGRLTAGGGEPERFRRCRKTSVIGGRARLVIRRRGESTPLVLYLAVAMPRGGVRPAGMRKSSSSRGRGHQS